MHIGHYISGGAHAALIGWVLFGGVFRSEPDPVEVTGVDIISTAQFEALLAAERPPAPETDVEVPVAPEVAPEPSPAPPEITPEPDAPTPQPQPTPVAPAPQDLPPAIPAPLNPPVAIDDTAPDSPSAPKPDEAAPVESVRPVARPVPRVAPEAVTAPDPDREIADVDQAPTAPSDDADSVETAETPTAREEAATEIPTEPQERASAPTTSVRPKARPNRPAAQPAPTETTEAPEDSNRDSSVNDALAAALAEADAPAVPSGPPLTAGERDALRISVQECWVVDVGSQAANVTVTIAMSLDRAGQVVSGSLRQIAAEGGDEAATRAAFDAARRAILRCQRGGYNLPIEKYDHWREVEMTFNPEKMRRR
ncbi:hypothetical protein N6L24_10855 [Cognatishimia sp. SS12]|uniref:hypothetical protein n=1 Tax=Cognatishimia sp. SS12 TaxID=2979465 RepID=UPI002330DD35|nr:hypothetical protein [Cognatishimia sp. SS12]MDC0738781.1 hypothetical protein [Cognatishimia sp. SS12]